MTATDAVLRELLKGGGVTTSEIAYRTGLGAAVVGEALCELEEHGLAAPYAWKRGPDAEDVAA